MLHPRADVRTVHAVLAKQLPRHARNRRRTVHLELGNLARALIPSLQHEARVVEAMVVVEMREKGVRHLHGPASALEEPMMGARTVIEDDHVVGDIDEITGALSSERRTWGAGTEKRDAH